MLPLPRISFLSVAAVCALVALTASSSSVRADDLVQNLGPVGPYEPILAPAGNKRLVAFYVPHSGYCAIDVVIWNNANPNGLVAKFWPDTAYSAERVEVNLAPGQIIRLQSAEDEGLNLKCGANSATLALIRVKRLLAGAAQ
jgi:hypothetical protein